MFEYTETDTLISIKNLTLKYGNQTILNNINMDVKDIVRPGYTQGQIIALLGPSGIGKTQLFKCIAGLQQPSEGAVLINSKPVQSGDVGVVFQNYPLFNHLTVKDNLLISEKDITKIEKILTQFSLTSLLGKYPEQLSGGQRQRISIIQQVLRNNHFLLMDEPFSGLDIISKQTMMQLIRSICSLHEHNTIILTTHDIDCAIQLADRIIIIGPTPNTIGATIIEDINLITNGIAWRDFNQVEGHITQMLSYIKNVFLKFGTN